MNYEIGKYDDQDTGRKRWAVFCRTSRVWYFSTRYGKKAAKQLADRLNREV